MFCENQRRWINGILFLLVIFIPIITYYSIFTGTPINFDLLTPQNARNEVSSNENFLIFWSVLTFTCLVGLIELFQLIKNDDARRVKIPNFLLFLILVYGIVLSIDRTWNIIRENYAIMISGLLGRDYKQYARSNASIFDHPIVRDRIFEFILVLGTVLILSSIFALKIGLWSKKENTESKEDLEARIRQLEERLREKPEK